MFCWSQSCVFACLCRVVPRRNDVPTMVENYDTPTTCRRIAFAHAFRWENIVNQFQQRIQMHNATTSNTRCAQNDDDAYVSRNRRSKAGNDVFGHVRRDAPCCGMSKCIKHVKWTWHDENTSLRGAKNSACRTLRDVRAMHRTRGNGRVRAKLRCVEQTLRVNLVFFGWGVFFCGPQSCLACVCVV